MEWMNANLLTLSSFKTEFLLIGLKQLAKIIPCSLDTSHSARNPYGFIFDENLLFDQISALSKFCYSHIHPSTSLHPPIS